MSTRLNQLYTFLENSPDDPFLLFAIAKEYEKLKNDEKTKVYFEKLVAEHENYVGTYYHLGKFYERQSDTAQAIVTYKKGMQVAQAQGDRHAYGELASAKMMIDDDDDE